MALSGEKLRAIEAERLHSDEDPPGCRLRTGNLFDPQHVWGSWLTNDCGLHGRHEEVWTQTPYRPLLLPLRPVRLHPLRHRLPGRCTHPSALLGGLGQSGCSGLTRGSLGGGARLPTQDAGRTLQGVDLVLELGNPGLPGRDGLGDLAHGGNSTGSPGRVSTRGPHCRRLHAPPLNSAYRSSRNSRFGFRCAAAGTTRRRCPWNSWSPCFSIGPSISSNTSSRRSTEGRGTADCHGCRAAFAPRRPWQRHCSPRCRAAVSRQRQAERLAEVLAPLLPDDPGRAE